MSAEVVLGGFVDALVAGGPHPSLGPHADTYGRLIGSWAGEYADHDPGGGVQCGGMEVHFAWVLQGLAVQDLWIAPPLAERRAGRQVAGRDTYGSTLRVFEPGLEAWRVVWLNPVKGVRSDLLGRRVGDDVVQTGYSGDALIKWVFSGITRESFLWQGFVLEADGIRWRTQTEFKLRRTA